MAVYNRGGRALYVLARFAVTVCIRVLTCYFTVYSMGIIRNNKYSSQALSHINMFPPAYVSIVTINHFHFTLNTGSYVLPVINAIEKYIDHLEFPMWISLGLIWCKCARNDFNNYKYFVSFPCEMYFAIVHHFLMVSGASVVR